MKTSFVTIREAEDFSKSKIKKGTFNWLISGAEDNKTTNENINFLNNLKIKPKILAKNFNFNFKKSFFGKIIKSPLILSPMGHQTQFHKLGEIEMAKAICKINTIGFFSTQGRHSFEKISNLNKNNQNLVWQIFLFGNKSWIENEIKRSHRVKSVALALCLDAPVRSHRYIDRESRYDARKHGQRSYPVSPSPKMALKFDWEIIKWIKKKSDKPLILKGIISADDAKLAIKYKADSIWISNHGGRMFNSGISSGEALISIKKNISKKIPIIVDGGVRRGSDIIKYLCLGANFVGIGRPAIYGLVLNGSKGVENIFNILNSEFQTNIFNGGFKSYQEINIKRIIKN